MTHDTYCTFLIFLIFLNLETFLLDLAEVLSLFKIKDPRKCTELVPEIVDLVDLAGGMKITRLRLRLYEVGPHKLDAILFYISINRNCKCCW